MLRLAMLAEYSATALAWHVCPERRHTYCLANTLSVILVRTLLILVITTKSRA